ncbi:MAG: bifunctional folylpolyglutamate synthase/dihydrofolate synthase [Muribaculaceae bacterium]|nr:bifunctional folylpolyglutamate synthase/dihydrofolate synthase [Muribaculaceae bacterium]
MDYKESLDWLFSQLPMFSRVGAAAYKPGLERSEALAAHFGHPERSLRAIHVAGTNGKGSVSNLIAATLQAQGYKVGLYTSPHLVDFRERMRINGAMIPEEDVIRFVEDWRNGTYDGDKPSFFELTMMMAFDWFAKEKVDYAVIEVGMGGRLDSTNILTPLLSVITNISFDHTQFLGDTLAEIAAEKAGIIKAGIPVVIGEAVAETEPVFRNKTSEVDAPLREAYNEIDEMANNALRCALTGDYQKKNVNTARIAIDELRRLGVVISREAEERGFREVESLTGFQGRWTKLSEHPLVICDTGHNEAGLSYNLGQLRRLLAERKEGTLRFVLGFVKDKDVDHILPMFPQEAVYYITQAAIQRAMPRETLLTKVSAMGLRSEGYPTVAEAAEAAMAAAGSNDIIYIGGSTFIVADYLASAR